MTDTTLHDPLHRPSLEGPTFLGHPRALVVLFLVEMWERFSYYGMRALLIFYLTRHFLFSDADAAGIYAAYVSLVYITPVIGGALADRYLGAGRAIVLGGLLLVAGHLGMAIEGPAADEAGGAVQRDGFYLQTFYLSLSLIVMGVGFLKANISTLVGELYSRDDTRRDGAYTLYYMGINLGAFLGAIFCGVLLEWGGFSWGFGAAGVGMLVGLAIFVGGRGLFQGRDEPRHPQRLRAALLPGLRTDMAIYLGAFVGVGIVWWLLQHRLVVGGLLATTLLAMAAFVVGYAFFRCAAAERDRLLVALLLMSYQVVFWSLFEQTGSSLNLLADRNVDRVVFGLEIPAATFQSVNAFFILLLAPLFGFGWTWLARRGLEPSTPMKFALSLIQLGGGFLVLVYGAGLAAGPSEVALIWLVLLYLLHTTGELCISPVGLSMTTRLSTPAIVGTMMGCWFLVSAAGNYVSGMIAAMTGADRAAGGSVDPALSLANTMDVYAAAGGYAIALGMLAVLLAPLIRRFMHGVH